MSAIFSWTRMLLLLKLFPIFLTIKVVKGRTIIATRVNCQLMLKRIITKTIIIIGSRIIFVKLLLTATFTEFMSFVMLEMRSPVLCL